MSFIVGVTTSCEAWTILSNTYAKLSHGCLKQVKIHLKNPIQGSQSAVEFLQHVKSHIDEPAIPGVPMDEEELTKKNLDDLNDEYIELI